MTDTLHEDLCAFMITYRSNLRRTRNVSDKSYRQIENAHLMLNNFFPKIVSIMRCGKKYGTARQARGDIIIRHMRFACWIIKTTDTYSEYVICIAFLRQQWLRERASILRLYVHYLSCHYCPRPTTASKHPSSEVS
jgi:hypothetical protein